ncbi:hypothetical protein [Streptomyces sp. TRM75563]|nr:hypothetical protein [Streptomyces sp. TRM75563]MCI4046104.1 hypothetical protein [Streptomyces sp. TRM75563]
MAITVPIVMAAPLALLPAPLARSGRRSGPVRTGDRGLLSAPSGRLTP